MRGGLNGSPESASPMTGGKLGPVIYRDPRTARRVWLTLGYLVFLFALMGGWLASWWNSRSDPVAISFHVLLVLAFFYVLILWGLAPQLGTFAVRADGISLPEDATMEIATKIPYARVEWAFFDSARPWRGIRMAVRGENERAVIRGDEIEDPASIARAIDGRVRWVEQDPDIETALQTADPVPDAYAELWLPKPMPSVGYEVLLATAMAASLGVGLLAVTLITPGSALLTVLVSCLGAEFLVLTLGLHPYFYPKLAFRFGKKGGMPALDLESVAAPILFKELEEFLTSEGKPYHVQRERKYPTRSRSYLLSESLEVRVDRVPRHYGATHWRLGLSVAKGAEGTIRGFQSSLARFLLARGLMDGFYARMLGILVQEKLASPVSSDDS